MEYAHPRPQSEPLRAEMALGITYTQALEQVGAIPVVLPPLAEPAIGPLLDQLAGVCLSGGPDLDPSEYGESADPELGPTWPELDRFELELARGADRGGIPVLGICRGAQTLNVARGGDLRQHLTPAPEHEVDHRQGVPGEQPTHPIQIEPDSRLAAIIGATELEVNSFHHQAVHRLGRGLRAVAHSPDGVIEAIEDPTVPFFVGVQWHAEYLINRADSRALLRGLVEAARGRVDRQAASAAP